MELSNPEKEYRETLSREGQNEICKSFMAHVEGWKLYEDWLEGRQIEDSDQALRAYCERLDSFWEFLERTTPNEE